MEREGTTFHPSILNTVLGPITLGPSSSHLAGPVRLGLLARSITGFTLEKAEVCFNEGGSFAATYKGHRTDCAFVSGLLGWDTNNMKIPQVFEEVKALGLDVEVKTEPYQGSHPNVVIFRGEGQGQKIEIIGASEGGGAVRILQIDGFKTNIDGNYPTLFILMKDSGFASEVLELVNDLGYQPRIISQEEKAITLELNRSLSSEEIQKISNHQEVVSVHQADPVFIVPKPGASRKPYFTSSQEILEIAESSGRKLWEIALSYEMNRLGLTKDEIFSHLDEMISVMKSSLSRGISEELQFSGGIAKQGGRRLIEAYKQGKTVSSGTLPRATAYAMAVNEVSASLGLIVAAPTAGACGVIPGAIFAVVEEMENEVPEEVFYRALLCAGAIGAVFAQKATFLAEYCGCQVETGIASGMAAAAIVEMKGGTVSQALDAASITMQNILGMECDPVAGLMEVPCITRNSLGTLNAIMSAEIVLAGVDSVIPFDEAIDATYETGRFRPLQCNGTGGLAITPTSKKLEAMQK